MTTTANPSPPSLGARIYHLSYVTAAVGKVGAIYEAVTKPVRNRDGVLKNTLEDVENKALKAVHAVEPIVQPSKKAGTKNVILLEFIFFSRSNGRQRYGKS